MTAIVRACSRMVPAILSDADVLITLALLCGAGLFVSLLLATFGLDMSFGFF